MSGLSDSYTSAPGKRVREDPITPNSAYKTKKMKGLQRTLTKAPSASASTTNEGDLSEAIKKLTSVIGSTNKLANWKKTILVNNQTELMNRIDQQERNQKRPIIVITGFDRETNLSARESIEQLFREKVSPDIVVASAYKINMKNGVSKFIATKRSVEDKITVMKGCAVHSTLRPR